MTGIVENNLGTSNGERQKGIKRFSGDKSLGAVELKDILEKYVCQDDAKHIIYVAEPTAQEEVMRVSLEELLTTIQQKIREGVKQFFIPICLQNSKVARTFMGVGGHFTCIYVDYEANTIECYDSHVNDDSVIGGRLGLLKNHLRKTQFEALDKTNARLEINELKVVIQEYIEQQFGSRLTIIDAPKTQLQKDNINCGRFMTHYILHRREKESLKEYIQGVTNQVEAKGYDVFIEGVKQEVVKKMQEETPQEP